MGTLRAVAARPRRKKLVPSDPIIPQDIRRKKATTTVSIRIDSAMLHSLQQVAMEQNVSRNFVIERFLSYALKQYVAQQRDAAADT